MGSLNQILLELAAIAAGRYELVFNDGQANAFYAGSQFYMTKPGSHTPWNPLTDDGDAQRLAAKLGINILWQKDEVVAFSGNVSVRESLRNGRDVALRRAIVRAAAEMGRLFKEAA